MKNPAAKKVSISLFMPIYQREDSLGALISRIPDIVGRIYIVIDAPDKKVLADLAGIKKKNNGRLELIINRVRKGVGHALRQAIERALKEKHDIFVVMAANGKDDPAQIPRLVKPILDSGFDYVQGSRNLEGGVSENLPFIRKVIINSLPVIWSLLNCRRYTEITNGFRAYKLRIFQDKSINIWQAWLDKYQMEYYIHYKATTGHYKFTEVPVSKIYRKQDSARHTKIRLKDGWQILSPLIYLKLGIRK